MWVLFWSETSVSPQGSVGVTESDPVSLFSHGLPLFYSLTSELCLVSSYHCQTLLVYYYTTNQTLSAAAVSARMAASEGQISPSLQVQPTATDVTLIGENWRHWRPLQA